MRNGLALRLVLAAGLHLTGCAAAPPQQQAAPAPAPAAMSGFLSSASGLSWNECSRPTAIPAVAAGTDNDGILAA